MPTAINPRKEQNQSQEKKRPAAEFRESNLRVTIWPSAGGDGFTRHNVIITRSYQSNGKWAETPYLGQLDLQRARKLLDRADDWIFKESGRSRDTESITS